MEFFESAYAHPAGLAEKAAVGSLPSCSSCCLVLVPSCWYHFVAVVRCGPILGDFVSYKSEINLVKANVL